ncbi:MAG: phosphoribosylamine--glycine ligase [Thermodesulfovibrionales bacterium]
MKVLVIGGGGREHAIVWKLSQSDLVDKIYCLPGNAGISEIAECVELSPGDFSSVIDFVKYEWIDLTIVGPEEPLAKGIVDAFQKEGRSIVGPCERAAQLEASKVFAKDFMKRHNIPTAPYRVFTSYLHAEDYIKFKGAPIVVKADGLAAGKGVFVAKTIDEAIEAVRLIMKEQIFGKAGERVIVEDCLDGEEASFMAFTDGKTIIPMVSSQDHKRVFDNDEGPNTGGMGAYSPAPVVTEQVRRKIMSRILMPLMKGLRQDGIEYRGIIYAGLMIKDGEPYVLEFNCRFGDPETQPVLMRMRSDLMKICLAITEQKLDETRVQWKKEASVCVVLASKGYPGKYEKGTVIQGLEMLKGRKDIMVFHAGTSYNNGNIVTSGGRVLGVTALGKDIKDAVKRAYSAVELIKFDGMHYRKDIAKRAILRENR